MILICSFNTSYDKVRSDFGDEEACCTYVDLFYCVLVSNTKPKCTSVVHPTIPTSHSPWYPRIVDRKKCYSKVIMLPTRNDSIVQVP